MVVIIRRRPAPPAEPLVPEVIPKSERTPAEAILDWKKQPALNAKPRICPYCDHAYINVCFPEQYTSCMNFKHKTKKEPKNV